MANGKNGPVAGFGLSEENIHKLREGMPIKIDGKTIGLNLDIIILYGKTEKDIGRMLSSLIGNDTIVTGEI